MKKYNPPKHIVYITQKNMKSRSAAAIQITEMVNAIKVSGYQHKIYAAKSYFSKSKHERVCVSILVTIYVYIKYVRSLILTRDLAVAFSCTLLGQRCFLEVHEPYDSPTHNKIFKYVLNKNHVQIGTTTETLAKYFSEKFSVSRDDFLIVPNSCRGDILTQKYEDSNAKETTILHFGSLYKDTSRLLLLLSEELDETFSLKHIGGTSEECEHLKHASSGRIAAYPQMDIAKLTNHINSAHALLYLNSKKSKIYKFSSPLKAFEYLSIAKPIISTNIGSEEEVFQYAECIYIDFDNNNQIRKILKEFQRDYAKFSLSAKNNPKKIVFQNYSKRLGFILNHYKSKNL